MLNIIKSMEIPTLEYLLSLKKGQLTGNFIKKKFPDFYIWISQQYENEDLSFSEKLYWYYHNITQRPVCITCGSYVKYHSFNIGYKRFCSTKCSSSNREVQNKKKQTCLEKYGVEHSSKKKETIQKMKQTNLKRYGCECSLHNEEVSKKKKQTWNEKYGYDHPTKSTAIKEKIKQTNLEKYGVVSTLQSNEVKEKSIKTKLTKYGDKYFNNRERAEKTNLLKYGSKTIFGVPEKQKEAHNTRLKNFIKNHNDYILNIHKDNGLIYTCKCPHPECDRCLEKSFDILSQHYVVRRYNNIELCTKLKPVSKDFIEGTSIELFIRNILDEYNIEYVCNDRTILNGKELDIYIPSKNVAIECNGIYWHSTNSSSDNILKHLNKWNKCNQKNIQLLTIWEDQILKYPDIIKSIVLSKLGIFERKIYARNCTIKELANKESSLFLENNHLQGSVNGSVKVGLYYNDELVSVMVFGKTRKIFNNSHNGWELYRFCNKLNTCVVGGASKLFKWFINNYKPIYIESFSSNDISNGQLYKTLGFTRVNKTTQSYWYIDNKLNRYHRYKFRKSELIKKGYDKDLSESKIMGDLNYFKIYDSGQSKYIIDYD